jgi:TonB family protein
MNHYFRWLLALVPLTLSLLTACTADGPKNSSEVSLPSAGDVARRCLARAAGSGEPVPAMDLMNGPQWRRYVSCALTSNMFVHANSDVGNPEAIVSLRVNRDGSVGSATLLHPSGNPAWDAAVQRAIAAASPLPAAPGYQGISRVDLHFWPRHGPLGIGGSTGITGQSHWSVRHCTTVGGTTGCG